MLAVAGTIPQADWPLTVAPAVWERGRLSLGGRVVPVNRGTPALLAAAAVTAQLLGRPAPLAVVAGDVGLGQGSRAVYAHLAAHLATLAPDVLAFHYLLPDLDWAARVMALFEGEASRPGLVADAGFMYAVKAAGLAPECDLFTPDVGELAFLADEAAPHPFYTRGFILQMEDRVPELIARAFAHANAARYLLVKGERDYVAGPEGIIAVVAEPVVPALEAIGGTGDTLTGLVAVLIESGWDAPQAARTAALANRLAGALARPTPATQIGEIIPFLLPALEEALTQPAAISA